MLDLSAHSYKCYLRACIQFNNALFHIFSGPLFANVEGYAYLDLLVWGLSPLSFLFLRQRLYTLLRGQTQGVRGLTFRGLVMLACVLLCSYFFLNYSPVFNWNYFSRTFNIEVGYFIFDMLIRTLELLVEIEEEHDFDKQCETYCQFQHATSTLAYFVVFYLASSYDVHERNNGPMILGISCGFSAVTVVLVPVLYYVWHRGEINRYRNLPQLEDQDQQQGQQQRLQQHEHVHREQKTLSSLQLMQQPKQTIRQVLGMCLVTTSLVINTNYFSLWMMQPLGTTTDSSYQQYNITIQMVSGCFLFSSVGYYLGYRLFTDTGLAPVLCRGVLLVYGVLLALAYWQYDVNYVSVLVLGFGFQQICQMEYAYLFRGKWNFDMRFYVKNEVIAYFVMPLIFVLFRIGQTSLRVYALVSGGMLAAGVLML